MEAKKIKVKLRYLIDKILEIEIGPEDTIFVLKTIVESQLDVETKDQKIIYRGIISSPTTSHNSSQEKCFRTIKQSKNVVYPMMPT